MSTTEIESLGLMEKIHLVEELWDMIADEADMLPVDDATKAELDRRMESFRRNPDKLLTREELKNTLARR